MSLAPCGPTDTDPPDLLRLTVTPGRTFIRLKKRKPMSLQLRSLFVLENGAVRKMAGEQSSANARALFDVDNGKWAGASVEISVTNHGHHAQANQSRQGIGFRGEPSSALIAEPLRLLIVSPEPAKVGLYRTRPALSEAWYKETSLTEVQ